MTDMNECAQFDHLEPRTLLSAAIEDGVLSYEGTQRADSVVIEAGEEFGQVLLFGVAGVEDGTLFEGVDRVRGELRGGDDRFEIRGSLLDTSGETMVVRTSGGSGDDVLIGGDSLDHLNGGSGNDFIDGGAGDDRIHGRQGHDILLGGDGDDFIMGNRGRDTVDGGAGDDIINVGFAKDTVFGGPGDDFIFGGPGQDILFGDDGNDEIRGHSAPDFIDGGAGDDLLIGSQGPDIIFGGEGNDWLKGWRGKDILRGGDGDDILAGNQQADDLFGGEGRDRLFGGEQGDIFRGPMDEWRDFGDEDAAGEDPTDDPSALRDPGEARITIARLDARVGDLLGDAEGEFLGAWQSLEDAGAGGRATALVSDLMLLDEASLAQVYSAVESLEGLIEGLGDLLPDAVRDSYEDLATWLAESGMSERLTPDLLDVLGTEIDADVRLALGVLLEVGG